MTTFDRLEKVADAVLYEGYLLYPYRPQALKNRRRWTFGCLPPPSWAAELGEPSWLQTECLTLAGDDARLSVRARFLHLDGEDAIETSLDASAALSVILTQPLLTFRSFGAIEVTLTVSACVVGEGAWRVRVRLDNVTTPDAPCPPTRDEALTRGLLSCHALLHVVGGTFLSSVAPPAEWRAASAGCRNVGLWPVLAGGPASPDLMLAAPIILYDHPQVAPQSPAQTFDATEIDEMIRLRLLTLTDEEKRQVTDARAGRLLDRVTALNEADALALRGAWKSGPRPGDRVRLRPARRADLFDVALAGKEATVVSVDEDLEGRTHVGVVIDDDPGRDLGLAGWPGHRFFFAVEEVEVL